MEYLVSKIDKPHSNDILIYHIPTDNLPSVLGMPDCMLLPTERLSRVYTVGAA